MVRMLLSLSVLVPAALLAVAGPAAAEPIGSDADACVPGGGPAILANVSGLKDRTGRLKLELYPATDDGFLKDDDKLRAAGETFRRVWAQPPRSGPVSICIRVPHPGRYALFFTHDRDGKNKFDIWSDGAGIPSNQALGRSKPKVGEATVTVGNGVTVTDIHAQYLHGFSGFSPNRSDG